MNLNIPLKYILFNAMDLSEKEKAVLAVLETRKMAGNVSRIAKEANVPRTTAIYILNKFFKWKIAKKVSHEKRTLWMFNKQMNYTGQKAYQR